jgi:mannose/fructose/N-acetylgalactosamine-specific phosphotransferase system component IIC
LTIMLVPTLTALRGPGKNLLVFFGALYAVRGFGVLTWFMAPGTLGITLAVGFVMMFVPVLNAFVALALIMVCVASLALGLGDTWADWRGRARASTARSTP